jgi:hypothetical protein
LFADDRVCVVCEDRREDTKDVKMDVRGCFVRRRRCYSEGSWGEGDRGEIKIKEYNNRGKQQESVEGVEARGEISKVKKAEEARGRNSIFL